MRKSFTCAGYLFNTFFMLKNVVCLGILMPLILLSCNSLEKNDNTIEEYLVASPTIQDTTFTKDYVADIQALKNVEIRSRVKGIIDKIHVDEGQFVKEGQLLFSISAQEYNDALVRAKAQLKNAQAELKSLQVELKNAKGLLAKAIISKSEVELAEAKVEAAEAKIDEMKSEVNTAQMNVSFTSVKAPFSGYINRIPNKMGSLIEEGTMLTTLSDNQEVYAYFRVSEFEYLNFMRTKGLDGKKDVQLILADNTVHDQLGIIETVEGEIDRSTGNVAFRARFNNPQKLIKHGASGKISIGFDLKKATLIPMSATFEIQENYYVYVVDEANTVRMRRIFRGAELGDHYVISKGLKASDRILLEGVQLVKKGQKIKVERQNH
jgi:RND family efflux transporter MFP subunit